MTSASLKWQTCSTEDFPFKRHKVSKACQLCRRKKIRCDGRSPCERCEQQNSPCHYDEQPQQRRQPQRKQNILNGDVHNSNDRSGTSPPRSTSPRVSSPLLPPPLAVRPSSCSYLPLHSPRVAFNNPLYESMRQRSKEDIISRSHLLATRVPPLLFDFFHLTSQPCKIWAPFIQLFTRFDRSARTEERLANALLKESLEVFAKHNHLYTTLFDWEHLTQKSTANVGTLLLNRPPAPENDDDDGDDTMLACAIHALVFRAAFQSLATTYREIAPSLEDYGHMFHREAQRRFVNSTFTKLSAPHESTVHRVNLVRATILLAHYHCAAVAEESAYAIIKVGMSHAASCSLSKMVLNDKHLPDLPLPEKRRSKRLFFILHAWQAWLSFYMYCEDWSEHKHLEDAMVKAQSFIRTDVSMEAGSAWSFQVVDLYITLLRRILKNSPVVGAAGIKNQLDTIQDACHLSDSSSKSRHKNDLLPGRIVVLYHQVLVIQLFSDQFMIDEDRNGSQHSKNRVDMQVANMASRSCIAAATSIIDVVDSLTMNYHKPMTEQNSRLRGQQYHRDPINSAVLYPICLAASLLDVSLRKGRGLSKTQFQRQQYQQESADWNISSAKVPIFKLQRLLNPICSQVEAARVIFEPLDRIQAAVRSSVPPPCAAATTPAAVATTAMETQHRQARIQPQRLGLPDTALGTKMHGNSSKLIARYSEHLWPGTTGFEHPFPEDIYLFDMSPSSKHIPSSRYMVNPYMLDRNEIDKQQLEKLSSIKDRRSTPWMESLSSNDDAIHVYGSPAAPLAPAQVPLFSHAVFPRYNGMAGQPQPSTIPAQGQKRRYTESMAMEYQQQQQQASTLANMGRQSFDYPRAAAAAAVAAAAAAETIVSARPTTGEFSHSALAATADLGVDGLPMYQEGYFLVDFNNSSTGALAPALAAPDNSNASRGNGNVPHEQSQIYVQPAARHLSQFHSGRDGREIKETACDALAETNGSFTSGNLVSDNPPRQLPLPPPKQQAPNNWAAVIHQRCRSEPFQASVLETLHPNTLGTYPFGSLCPSTMGFVQHHHEGACMSSSDADVVIQQMNIRENISYLFNMESNGHHPLDSPAASSIQPSSSATHPVDTATTWIDPSKLASTSRRHPKRNDQGNQQQQLTPSSSISSASSQQVMPVEEVSSAADSNSVAAAAASILGSESQQWLEMASSCSKMTEEATGNVLTSWQE